MLEITLRMPSGKEQYAIGPIHTMRHVSVQSPFHLRSVRMVCVHTVRCVQSPSRTARDSSATISIKYSAPFVF